MNFARAGLPFIAVTALVTAGVYAAALLRRSWPLWLLAFLLTLVTLWVAYFFRDPERQGARGETLVISPADGRVMSITEVDEPLYLHGPALRLSIFLNIFNVHVNRYPVGGTVEYVHYEAGKFFNAAADRASLENEQMSVGINTGRTRVLVRQIAGLIARRLETYSREGERVEQGDRMGLMRFGSRMDVFIPVGSAVRVRVGDNVVAGVTVLAELAGT
ncbi:MAG TPA: phosphatidylserine decarboxylase family protein [Gemmatimonadaceae bacterium]|nr:phosphatidylserine decarboxylase family protein [Gemmatimonadaceae bacterium]